MQLNMNRYSDILLKIALLNTEEQSLRMSEKLNYIQKLLERDCITLDSLNDLFKELNKRSLQDQSFAFNVAYFISSSTFTDLKMFEVGVRNIFLNILQKNYDNVKTLLESDENKFYNSVTLIAEYYNRARILGSKPLHFLVEPILKYLQIFVDLNTERAAKELVTQLSLNGRLIKTSNSRNLRDFMRNVREATLTTSKKQVKFWLMKATDLVINNFHLEDHFEKFYKSIEEQMYSKVQSNILYSNLDNKVNGLEETAEVIEVKKPGNKNKENQKDLDKLKEFSLNKKTSLEIKDLSKTEILNETTNRKKIAYKRKENFENVFENYFPSELETPVPEYPFSGMFATYLEKM